MLGNAASIHVQRWASCLSERGHDVHVVSLDGRPIDGAIVHTSRPVGARSAHYALLVAKTRQVVREVRPDVVHAHYAVGYGTVAALAGCRPLVTTVWGSDVLIAPRESRVRRAAVRHALRRAGLVVSVAHHMTPALRSLGVPDAKIVVLPMGADTAVFRPGPPPAERAVDIVCTRSLEPVYNVESLLRAIARVTVTRPDVTCVLIGDGSQRAHLVGLARQLGVDRNIAWAGRLPPAGVAAHLANARVYVTPARSDGSSVSLAEAMACGCFPIGTDIPANREWLRDGRTGFLVPADAPDALADRLIHALASEPLRRDAAAANLTLVAERGTWSTNMDRMEAHYRRLAGDRAGQTVTRGAGADEPA